MNKVEIKKQIILASTSPRRRQVIELLGQKVLIVGSDYEEIVNPKLSHKNLVKFLALGKAEAVAEKHPNAVIISADTMVSFKGQIIGKPNNEQEATSMMKMFSGKSFKVITGTVVLDTSKGRKVTGVTDIIITFKKLSKQQIAEYVKTKEPYDKAGGFNLQGGGFNLIAKINGDFTHGLGLPMTFVFNALKKLGVVI